LKTRIASSNALLLQFYYVLRFSNTELERNTESLERRGTFREPTEDLKHIRKLIRIERGDFLPKKNPFELPSMHPSKPKRDSRRSFNRTQKNDILHQQDNKCAICHKKLDSRDIHYHHKKPWSSGGGTITENGRAVCGSCHNIISHKERLKKVDKKRKRKQSSPFDLPKVKFPKI
jgi:hypothetical protein